MIDKFRDILLSYEPSKHAKCAIDFETYYDSECSVSDSTYWHYTHHKKFDAYMVSIYSPELGIEYVGHPRDFKDWEKLEGAYILAHNSPFDRQVYQRLREIDPEVYHVDLPVWINTADLAAYLSAPRSLAKAAHFLLGKTLDKGVRADMKGKVFADLPKDVQQTWLDYAMEDAIASYELWSRYNDQWPVFEQKLSLHTTECVFRGVAVDEEKVEEYIKVLKQAIFVCENRIPWAGDQELTPTGKPRFKKTGEPVIVSPTSTRQLAIYARECGIPLPSTTSAKSEEYQQWEEKYGKEFPVIRYVQTWRKTNRTLGILEQIKSKLRDDGRMEFQLSYFGAQATGRWSGSPGASTHGEDEKGLNMQNLTKAPLYFDKEYAFTEDSSAAEHKVDIRSLFIAPEGKKFIISDLSQIEPRTLALLTGNTELLETVASGASPYEAHARSSMGWTGGDLKKEDPKVYALAKARVLALGYSASYEKFISMAAMHVGPEVFQEIFTATTSESDREKFKSYLHRIKQGHKVINFDRADEETKDILVNSWLQVMDFRKTNPAIVNFWYSSDRHFKISAMRKEDHEVELPSGRTLKYFNPLTYDGKSQRVMGGSRVRTYGGLIVENCLGFSTEVLSKERGWIPIGDVKATDMIWDGVAFVTHEGLLDKGVQEVITLPNGITSTPDHLFLVDGRWTSAKSVCNLKDQDYTSVYGKHKTLQTSSESASEFSGGSLRFSDSNRTSGVGREDPLEVCVRLRERSGVAVLGVEEEKVGHEILLKTVSDIRAPDIEKKFYPQAQQTPDVCCLEEHEGEMHQPETQSLQELWGQGDYCLPEMVGQFREFSGGHGGHLGEGPRFGPNQQRRRVLRGELSMGDTYAELAKHSEVSLPWMGVGFSRAERHKEEHVLLSRGARGSGGDSSDDSSVVCEQVYDIKNCGPRNRFVVRHPYYKEEMIAHNCTQGAARDAFGECILRLEEAGIPVIWHVHDEVICEVGLDVSKKEVEKLMSIPPSWANTKDYFLPVAAEAIETPHYLK